MNGELFYPNAFSAQGGSSIYQTLSFSNQNGVSFTNTNGQVGISHDLQFSSNTSNITSNAAISNHSHNFATTTTNGSVIVVGTTNSAGATIAVPPFLTTAQAPGAYLTTAALSNHSHNFATTTTNGSVIVVGTTNSAGATIAVPPYLTTAQAPGAYLTTARASNDAIGLNSALTANGVSMTANSSGLSLNFPVFLTTAALSNHSHNFATTTTNGSLIVVATTGSAGATIAVPPYLTTAQAPGAYLTTAAQSNQVVNSLNGSTGQISLNVGSSLSASTNGSSITFGLASNITTALQPAGAYLTTARASNDAVGLNTAQTNVVWTVNSSGISFNAAGYAGTGLSLTNATATLNSNGLQLSVGGGGVTNQTGPNIAAGTETGTSGTIVFSNSNNITFGMSNSSVVTASFDPINIGISNIGNTAGTTGTFDGAGLQYIFVGSNGIQLSQSSNNRSVSLSIQQNLGSFYSPPWAYSGMATNSSLGQSTLYFMPFDVAEPVYGSRINFYISYSGALSAGNSTGSCSARIGYGLYTLNSDSLNRLTSYEAVILSHTMNSNTQYVATHINGLLNTTSHSTSQLTISNANASTYLATSINGPRAVPLPLNLTLTQGRYWLGMSVQTNAGNAMTNNLSVMVTSVGVQPDIRGFAAASAASNASVFRMMQGLGFYSAQSAGWPASIAYTTDNIRAAVNQTLVHFDIKGVSYATTYL